MYRWWVSKGIKYIRASYEKSYPSSWKNGLYKGRVGGLKLGLKPSEINLGDLLKVTEDNMNIVECFSKPESCPLMSSGCKLKHISSQALNQFIKEFSKYTLADLL